MAAEFNTYGLQYQRFLFILMKAQVDATNLTTIVVKAKILTVPTREDSTKQKRRQHTGTLFQGRIDKRMNTRLHLRVNIYNNRVEQNLSTRCTQQDLPV